MTLIIKQSLAERNSNPLLGVYGKVLLMELKPRARKDVAEKLKKLMESPSLDSQQKVAKKTGLSQKTIDNLLSPDSTEMKSPKLSTVEALAQSQGMELWEFLRPDGVSEVTQDSSKNDVRFGRTRIEKQLLAYLSAPGIAESVLGLLTAVSGRGAPRGKVRLSTYGRGHSVSKSRKGSARRKGPAAPDS